MDKAHSKNADVMAKRPVTPGYELTETEAVAAFTAAKSIRPAATALL
jgi:hypothetical protein